MFTSPVTFREAEQQLSERLDTPTAMKYTDITLAWDAEARQHAFFSARVAEASILSELHGKVQAVLDGRMTTDQARRLLRNYFVGDGADALARLGFAPPRDAHGVAELSSIARINLILETNIRIAQETAHYRRWAELKAAYPYGIWRCGVCENHREEHLARDGKVYAFDHPIWTQSPPGGEFNCHCTRELCSQKDLERMGLSPEPLDSEFEKSSLGFDPSRGMQPPPPSDRTPRGIVDALANALEREAQVPGSPANPDTPPNITPGSGVDRPSLVDRLREKLRSFREMLARRGKGRQEQYLAGTGAAGKTNAREEANMQYGSEELLRDGVTANEMTAESMKQRINEAQNTIADVFQIDGMPVNTVHRLMPPMELKAAAEKGLLGKCVVSRAKKDTYDISIRPDNPHPGITDIHETIHALVDSGYITKKHTDAIFKAIRKTDTYKANKAWMEEKYGEKSTQEWVTRALAWYAAAHSQSLEISKEALEMWGFDGYGNEVWRELEPNDPKHPQSEGRKTSELEAVIMKQIPFRGILKKAKKLIGLTDEEERQKAIEEENRLEAEAKQRVQNAISPDLWKVMEEEIEYKNSSYMYVERMFLNAGYTLQEVAERFKDNIAKRKLWKEHPELKPPGFFDEF